MIISGHFVVTIHRRPLRALEELRARYDEHPLRGEQFLVYKILDAMTATFFPVLTRIDDDIDEIGADSDGGADRDDHEADLLDQAGPGRDAARGRRSASATFR